MSIVVFAVYGGLVAGFAEAVCACAQVSPSVVLEHLGAIDLQAPAPPAKPSVLELDIDDRGRFGLLSARGCDLVFSLVDPQGILLVELELRGLPTNAALPIFRWHEGNRWAVFLPSRAADRTQVWIVDAASCLLTELAGSDFPHVDSIASDHAGGFVAHRTGLPRSRDDHSPPKPEVVAFDRHGKIRWRYAGNKDDRRSRVPTFAAVGVTTDRKIAIFDENDRNLLWLELDGSFIKTQSSGEFHRCVPSESVIVPDIRGGMIIMGRYGVGPIRRIQSDGTEWLQLKPRYEDGRIFSRRGDVHVAPDGRVWVHDGEALLRLDDTGQVDLRLGTDAVDGALRHVGDAAIDPSGRTYLMNGKTGEVHVFDCCGRRMHVCQPEMGDFAGTSGFGLLVGPSGEVYVGQDRCWQTHLAFSPTGLRWGLRGMGVKRLCAKPLLPPCGSNVWLICQQYLDLIDTQGHMVSVIKTRCDRSAFEYVLKAASALDGTVAVVSRLPGDRQPLGAYGLDIYTEEGEPICAIDLPPGRLPLHLVFNGRKAVLGLADTCYEIHVFDVAAGSLSLVKLPESLEVSCRWEPFFSAGGDELWLLNTDERRVERFRVP